MEPQFDIGLASKDGLRRVWRSTCWHLARKLERGKPNHLPLYIPQREEFCPLRIEVGDWFPVCKLPGGMPTRGDPYMPELILIFQPGAGSVRYKKVNLDGLD